MALVITATIQSSSVTTSLVVPLVGAGLLTIRKIFPYTLGANVGTTVTAMLAAFATVNPIAITVAFTHFLFNVFGIVIIYPFKWIPISLAEKFAELTSRSKKNTIIFVMLYVPCFVTVISISKESSWRWALFSILFNLVTAYIISFIVYRVGSFLGFGPS